MARRQPGEITTVASFEEMMGFKERVPGQGRVFGAAEKAKKRKPDHPRTAPAKAPETAPATKAPVRDREKEQRAVLAYLDGKYGKQVRWGERRKDEDPKEMYVGAITKDELAWSLATPSEFKGIGEIAFRDSLTDWITRQRAKLVLERAAERGGEWEEVLRDIRPEPKPTATGPEEDLEAEADEIATRGAVEALVAAARSPKPEPELSSDWLNPPKEEKVFAPERMREPMGPEELAHVARTRRVKELAAKTDAARRAPAPAAEATPTTAPVEPTPATALEPSPALAPEPPVTFGPVPSPEEPVILSETTTVSPSVDVRRAPSVFPPLPRVETPVHPVAPHLRRPVPPLRFDRPRVPTPEPTPAARVDTPAPEPARGAARTEAEKAADARAEAVRAYKEIQTLLEQARETKAAMKKLKGLFGVRDKDEEEYETLEDRLETIQDNLDDAKDNYRDAIEDASELLEVGAGTLRKEIEKEVAAETVAGGAGGVGGEGGRDIPPREREKLERTFWERLVANSLVENLTKAGGVNLPFAIAQRRFEREAKKTISGEMAQLMKEFDAEFDIGARKVARENEPLWFLALPEEKRKAFDQRVQTLRNKVDLLVKEQRFDPKRRDQILGEVANILTNRAKEFDAASANYVKEGDKITNDYLVRKGTAYAIGKEAINSALVASQQWVARGLTLFAAGPLERIIQQKKEYTLDLRAKALREGGEAKDPGFWEKTWEVVGKRTVGEGIKEYLRSLTFQGATEDRKRVFGRSMDAVKALLTTARFAAIGFTAYTGWNHDGITSPIRQNVAEFLDHIDKKGLLKAGAENVLSVPGRIWKGMTGVYHWVFDGPRGHEVLQPAESATAAPAEAHAGSQVTNPEVTEPPLLEKHGVVQSLVDNGKATLYGNRLTIELGDRTHGFSEIQQALRRVVLEDLKVQGAHLTDEEMNRAEKIIKLLTHTAHNEHVSARWFDSNLGQARLDEVLKGAQGIVHLDAHGDLVVEDIEKLKTIMPDLEMVADKYQVSMMAYIDNTRRSILQEIMDKRTHSGARIIVDDFDKSPKVQAEEQRIGNLEAHAFGGKDITNIHVLDEDSVSFTKHADGYDFEVHVSDGELDYITANKGGAFVEVIHPTISTGFEDPLGHAKLSELLKDEIAERATIEPRAGDAAAAVERAPVAGGGVAESIDRTPHFANDLVKTVEEGGLKGPDGKLHFGSFALEEQWFQSWDDQDVGRFMDEAPARFSPARLFSSENDAHYKLAHAMELHKADPKMTVGQWAVQNYKKIEEWTR